MKSSIWPEKPFFIKIVRRPDLIIDGLPSIRHAVRAIIVKDGKLLMVYSTVNRDYKFPGGGIKNGEMHTQALRRELCEETGSILDRVNRLSGISLEYDRTKNAGYGYFKMFSYFYLCTINEETLSPQLDPYEAKLGFTPAWVPCVEALKNNERLLADTASYQPGWLKRETAVLQILSRVIR
jgi:8-oxo-dGTP pyrophosphatase MutT (NUDIX family)